MAVTIAEKVERYFSKYPKRSYDKGQILIFGGENPEHILYIIKGSVLEYDITVRGDEVVVNIFKPHAFFPMSWAISRIPNKYFFKTETKTDVRVVPVGDALVFVKDNPDVLFDLVSRLYIGVEALLGKIVKLMSSSARIQILYELLLESRRINKTDDLHTIILGTTETDIAARTGLSRETVSREMQKLKAEDLVSLNHDGITVKDIQAIEKSITSDQ